MPSTVRFATNGIFNESIQYRYDSMGNIVEIFENGRSACRYEYDALGCLTREENVAFAKTTTWAYDNNVNLIKQSNGLEFFYDHTGVFAVKYFNIKSQQVKS